MKKYICLFVIFSSSLLASGGEHHGVDWEILIGSIFNFLLLAFAVVFFTKKKVKEALVKRKEDLENQINAFQKAKEEAQAELLLYKEKLSSIDTKIAEIKANYELNFNSRIKTLEEKNEADINKLKQNYERELQARIELVHKELKQELMDNAIALSKDILIDKFEKDSKEELALIQKFSVES